MILNYTLPNAEKLILAGIKKHTIREDRNDRWKAGMKIHHTTGARTKKYKCFLENSVVSTQQILIVVEKCEHDKNIARIEMRVDREDLKFEQQQQLLINDGFENPKQFFDFFFPRDKKGEFKKTMFAGKIIHWSDLKY